MAGLQYSSAQHSYRRAFVGTAVGHAGRLRFDIVATTGVSSLSSPYHMSEHLCLAVTSTLAYHAKRLYIEPVTMAVLAMILYLNKGSTTKARGIVVERARE